MSPSTALPCHWRQLGDVEKQQRISAEATTATQWQLHTSKQPCFFFFLNVFILCRGLGEGDDAVPN